MAVEISLTPAEFKEYWSDIHDQALAGVAVKGFRPGTAPKELAEAALNQEKIFEEAIQDAVRFSLNKVIEENLWTVIDRPQVEIADALTATAVEKNELKFKAELSLFPEVHLSDYKKIAQNINAEKLEVVVTSEEIEKAFLWLRKSRAPLVRATRGAQRGDVIEADIFVSRAGQPIAGGDIKNDRFELGEGKFIPGFEEKIIGHNEKEEIAFDLAAPDNYWQKELRGQTLSFKVVVKAIFEQKVPEVTEEFVKSLGKFSTAEDVKKSIGDGLRAEKEEKEREKRRAKMLDEMTKIAKIDMPEVFVTRTLDHMVEELRPTLEKVGENMEEARKGLRSAAEKRVAANLIVHEIAKIEKLAPTKEEIEEESKTHAYEARGLDAGKLYDYIYDILINRKVLEFLEQ